MARQNDSSLVLKLEAEVGLLRRTVDRDEAMLRSVQARRHRIKPVPRHFYGTLNLQRSPYLCQCGNDHRAIWVNKTLECPFTTICQVGKLELRGLSRVPINTIVELAKI